MIIPKSEWKMEGACSLVDFDVIQCPEHTHARKRRAVHNPWTNGKILYTFDFPDRIKSPHSSWSISKEEASNRIVKQFNVFPMVTFVRVPKNEAKVRFLIPPNPDDCSATIGMDPNARVHLGASSRCWKDSTILHELGHVVGLRHTQNRDDRHTYINAQVPPYSPYSGTFSFDFASIMMYPLKALKATLTTKGRTRMEIQGLDEDEVGYGDSLSRIDIQTLEKVYGAGPDISSDSESVPYVRLLWVVGALLVLLVSIAIIRSRKCEQKKMESF